MEIRLNKLISEAGVCSRREADQFIETGRVTVNGKVARMGQTISENDEVAVDGEKLNVARLALLIKEEKQEESSERELINSLRKNKPKRTGDEASSPKEKYGKFNKYAAARKALKEGGKKPSRVKFIDEEKLLRDALTPRVGKSLRKSSIAQQIAANPKSAALRKTSRNNPINKAKRAARRRRSN